MNWPWCSRLAFDLVAAERDALRADNIRLMENLLRLYRHNAGLPEVARQPREAVVEPMPIELAEFFAGFWDGKLAKMQRAQAYRANARGKSWPDIMKEAMDDESPPATGS